MRIALDTNVLGYTAGVGEDEVKRARASWLLKTVPPHLLVIPSQVIGEFYNILCRKGAQNPSIAAKIVLDWADALMVATPTPSTMRRALETAAFQSLQVWDALILNIASEAGCRLLLSEDLQDGFTCQGVTVVNPFAGSLHPLLASVLPEGTDT